MKFLLACSLFFSGICFAVEIPSDVFFSEVKGLLEESSEVGSCKVSFSEDKNHLYLILDKEKRSMAALPKYAFLDESVSLERSETGELIYTRYREAVTVRGLLFTAALITVKLIVKDKKLKNIIYQIGSIKNHNLTKVKDINCLP